jgi:hypothetical protein
MAHAIVRLLGRRAPVIPMPLPFFRVAAVVGEIALREPPVTTDNIDSISAAEPINIAPAQRDLDFNPRAFEEGFRRRIEVKPDEQVVPAPNPKKRKR